MSRELNEMSGIITKTCENRRFVSSMRIAEALYNAGYRKQIEAENMAMYPTSAFECSLCGWSNWDLATGDGTYKYCPNCGAKMKGANNEN